MIGPECVKYVEREMDDFCWAEFGESMRGFVDGCASDFAGDYDQTLEEYYEERGPLYEDLDWEDELRYTLRLESDDDEELDRIVLEAYKG